MPTAVTDATFDEEVLKSTLPVLVDFWAPWCGPCKAMLPVMEELEKEYEGTVKLVKVNVDENAETPSQYSVMSIPMFVLFKDGKAVSSFVGARSKAEMKKALDTVVAA